MDNAPIGETFEEYLKREWGCELAWTYDSNPARAKPSAPTQEKTKC